MGSVHKVGEHWCVSERIDGRQKWFRPGPCGFPNTERGAKAYLAKIDNEIATGTYITPTNQTVADYAQHWLKTYAEKQCEPGSVKSYRDQVNVHIIPGIGHIKLRDLKPADIETFYANLKRKDGRPGELAQQTKFHIHRVLSGILNHAVEMEVIAKTPMKKALTPKVTRQEKGCYNAEQVRQVIALVADTPIHLPVVLAIYTGMRVGEICALKWSNVNFARQTITVQHSLEYLKRELREKTTKTGKTRQVKFGSVLEAALVKEKAYQAARRLAIGARWKHHDLVTANTDGTPRIPLSVSDYWRLLPKGDLPYYSFHAFRHTHVSLLISLGEKLEVIQERVGHANISMTKDTYGHLFEGYDEQAAIKLDKALGS
jgi:integrase